MKGTIRVVWTADGEVQKDETYPYDTAIEKLGDGVGILDETKLEVTFVFDPPVEPRRSDNESDN